MTRSASTCDPIALALAAVALAACGRAPTAAARVVEADENGIRAAWRGYVVAATERRGLDAVGFVSERTTATYDHLRHLALHADREQLGREPLIDRIRAIALRAHFPPEQLEAMVGPTCFAQAIRDGIVEAHDAAAGSLTSVEVDGDRGSAVYVSREHGPGPQVTFVREDGTWRLDAESLVGAAERSLRTLARQADCSEDEFVLAMVASLLDREIDDSVWTPSRRRGRGQTGSSR